MSMSAKPAWIKKDVKVECSGEGSGVYFRIGSIDTVHGCIMLMSLDGTRAHGWKDWNQLTPVKGALVLACDGQAVLRTINRLLKRTGWEIRQSRKDADGTVAGGDQRFLFIEPRKL